MLVLVAVMMIIFIVSVTFSIDVAYMQLTRTKLRTSTDAAARAAAEALSRLQNTGDARAAAKLVARRNEVAGEPLQLQNSDIVFGNSIPQAVGVWTFTPGNEPYNAVQVTGRRTSDSRSGSVGLFFGGLLGTGTFEPTQVSTVSHLERDVCLVVDRSGSMAFDLSGVEWSYPPGGEYCTPPHASLSRWGALTNAVLVFTSEIANTRVEENIALVSYATSGNWCGTPLNASDIEQRLTVDYQLVNDAMNRIGSNPIPGGTNISAGISNGIVVLTDPDRTRRWAEKTMIVLTDGHHNSGQAPKIPAQQAANLGITIHTVTFSADADQATMLEVAKIGKGNHYHAPNETYLKEVFKEIALTLPVIFTD
jgi:hypothetical protein